MASGHVIERGPDTRSLIRVDQGRPEDLVPLVLLHHGRIALHIGGEDAVRNGRRVFVVAGSSHVVVQERALRAALKPR